MKYTVTLIVYGKKCTTDNFPLDFALSTYKSAVDYYGKHHDIPARVFLSDETGKKLYSYKTSRPL